MREIARIEAMGVRIVLNHKVEDLAGRKRRGRVRRRCSSPSARRRQACRYSGARRRAGARRRLFSARRRDRRRRRASGAASSSTAAETRRWMRRAPPGAWAPRKRSSSTGAIARTCRRMRSKPTKRSTEGVQDPVADRRSARSRVRPYRRKDGARRQRSAASDGRVRDARGRCHGARARPGDGQRVPAPGTRIGVASDGVVKVGGGHDDRSSGHLRRRRMVPASGRSPSRWATASAPPGISMPGCAASACRESAKHALVDFDMLHLPVYSDADPSAQRALALSERMSGFEEVVAGLSEVRRATKRNAACPAATASNAITALPLVRKTPSSSWGPAGATVSTYDRCTGCAVCFEQCPCHAIDMIPEPRMES